MKQSGRDALQLDRTIKIKLLVCFNGSAILGSYHCFEGPGICWTTLGSWRHLYLPPGQRKEEGEEVSTGVK